MGNPDTLKIQPVIRDHLSCGDMVGALRFAFSRCSNDPAEQLPYHQSGTVYRIEITGEHADKRVKVYMIDSGAGRTLWSIEFHERITDHYVVGTGFTETGLPQFPEYAPRAEGVVGETRGQIRKA